MADATTTTTTSPQQVVADQYKYITDAGRALLEKPYEPYTGELIPELTASQKAAIQSVQDNANAAAAGYQTAQQNTAAALQAINESAGQTNAYLNQGAEQANQALQVAKANADLAQKGYTKGYGAADLAANMISQGANVAQPYFTTARGVADQALPGFTQASNYATKGLDPLNMATYYAQPAYQKAMADTAATYAGYTPEQYQASVQGYLSPYIKNVVDATAAQMQQVNQQQQLKLLGSRVGAGAFGGDRANVSLSELQNQQNLAMGQVLGGLMQAGYQDAAKNYLAGLQQQGVLANQYGQLGGQAQKALIDAGLAQQTAAKNISDIAAQKMAGATSYGALGTAAQNAALQGVGLQQANARLYGDLGAGSQTAALQAAELQGKLAGQISSIGSDYQTAAAQRAAQALAAAKNQGSLASDAQASSLAGAEAALKAAGAEYAVKQAQDAAAYQLKMQEQAYPYQSLANYANLAYGLGSQGGTSTTSTPVGNDISSILGIGTALTGLLSASDERLKDNMHPIGETYDGQKIYRFNYKGDPKTQVGFSAQETEKHHPESVYKTEEGIRLVDYDKATHHAAKKGHFALGGEASMGGLVPYTSERHPYATSGYVGERSIGEMPYVDDPLMDTMRGKSGLGVISYIPQIRIAQSNLNPKEAEKYVQKEFDTAGAQAFVDAAKAFNKKYNLFAYGGLVPREAHQDGESVTEDDSRTVSAEPQNGNFLSGLGGIIPSVFNKGQPLSDEARLAIIAAGLGMAASPSPSALQAIGQGGLIGVNTYGGMKKAEYDYKKALAEQDINAQRLGIEKETNKIRAFESNLKAIDNAKSMLEFYRAKAAAIASRAGGEIPAELQNTIDRLTDTVVKGSALYGSSSPLSTQGAGAQAPEGGATDITRTPSPDKSFKVPEATDVPVTKPQSSVETKQPSLASAKAEAANAGFKLPADMDPDALMAQAERVSAVYPEASKALIERAQKLSEQYAKDGGAYINGEFVALPNYAATIAERESAKTKAQESAKAPFELVEVVQPDGSKVKMPKSEAIKLGQFTSELSPAEAERQKKKVESEFELVDVIDENGNTVAKPKSEILNNERSVSAGPGSPPGATADRNASPAIKKLPEWQTKMREKIAQDELQMGEDYRKRDVSLSRLNGLLDILTKYEPGKYQDQITDIVKSLNALGITPTEKNLANAQNFEIFTKGAIQEVFNSLPAGRILQAEIQGLAKANANAGMTPGANAKILGDARALIKLQNKYVKDYTAWREANPNAYSPNDVTRFDLQWSARPENSLDKMKADEARKIGYVGNKIPSREQHVHGQAYYVPSENRVMFWDKNITDPKNPDLKGAYVGSDPLGGE